MDHELSRLKADLDIIRSMTGVGEPLTADDLRVNLLTALAGVVALVWTLLPHGYMHVWGLVAVLIPFGYILLLGRRYRRSPEASPGKQREYSQDLKILWLAIPYVGYSLWARQLGVKPLQILGTAVFFVAIQMLAGAVTDYRLRYIVCWGAALAIGALLIPAVSLSPVTIVGFVIAIGGGSSSVMIYRQLQQARAARK